MGEHFGKVLDIPINTRFETLDDEIVRRWWRDSMVTQKWCDHHLAVSTIRHWLINYADCFASEMWPVVLEWNFRLGSIPCRCCIGTWPSGQGVVEEWIIFASTHCEWQSVALTAEKWADVLFEKATSQHSLPRRIYDDRDPRYTSRYWQHLWSKLGTKLKIILANNSRENIQKNV